MCYFITVACTAAEVKGLRAILRSPFRLSESKNPSIITHLPDAWVAFHLAEGMCACRLYHEAKEREESRETEIERFRERHKKPKYRKRGWSDAKIERAIEDMRSAKSKSGGAPFTGIRKDLRQRIGDVVKLAGRVAVLVHWYSGEIDDEDVRFNEATITAQDFIENDEIIDSDVLYILKRDAT